ncbi:MAG: hypothetical protein ACI4R9_07245 [Kiritimatiellia bacterium]
MEKMIKKMMVAGLACIAMCGTAMAAPRGGNGPQAGRAPEAKPMAQQTPKTAHKAPVAAHKQNNRPMQQVARHKTAPQPVMHRTPAPVRTARHKPARRPKTPCHRHHRHECNDCHYDDNGWIELGAGLIGGVIGALIAG